MFDLAAREEQARLVRDEVSGQAGCAGNTRVLERIMQTSTIGRMIMTRRVKQTGVMTQAEARASAKEDDARRAALLSERASFAEEF